MSQDTKPAEELLQLAELTATAVLNTIDIVCAIDTKPMSGVPDLETIKEQFDQLTPLKRRINETRTIIEDAIKQRNDESGIRLPTKSFGQVFSILLSLHCILDEFVFLLEERKEFLEYEDWDQKDTKAEQEHEYQVYCDLADQFRDVNADAIDYFKQLMHIESIVEKKYVKRHLEDLNDDDTIPLDIKKRRL